MPHFPANAWWEQKWNDTHPSQNRSWKITHKQEVLKIDMGCYLSNIYITKYCQVIKEQYVEYFYSRQTCFWSREQVAGMIFKIDIDDHWF